MEEENTNNTASSGGVKPEKFAALRTEITLLANPKDKNDLNMDDIDERRLQNCLRMLNKIEETYYS